MTMPGLELLALRIKLPYATEEEFIEKYGTNVARGGIFIATRATKPEGTGLAFELVLANGERLLRGEGVVVKAQIDERGARRGMTVRFSRLDEPSKALVERVFARRASNGASPTLDVRSGASVANAGLLTGGGPSAVPEPKRRPSVPETPAQPGHSSAEPLVLGIDVGTASCRVAVYRDGTPCLLPVGPDGSTALPSVVYLDDKGRFLVGARACTQLRVDPRNSVFGLKRLLGRRMRSQRMVELAARLPFTLAADQAGDVGVELRGKIHSLVDLTALLLGELKDAARAALAGPVNRAVLCAPSFFTDRQRTALLEAGRRAGLDVVRLVNEPSAAAAAFGYGKGLARKRVLVFDLGGGTFDASVVELTGDDLEVTTAGGDNFLGGIDLDLRLSVQLSTQLAQAEGFVPDGSLHARQRLREAAETAKIALSQLESTRIEVPFVAARDDGSAVDLKMDLTRAALDAIQSDWVQRAMDVTRGALDAGGLKADGLDELVLIGGQSKSPLVRKRLQELLGKAPRADVDPDGAVALGAALLGHAAMRSARGKTGGALSEVLTAPIGICVQGGGMRRVLERNTRLPAEKSVAFPVRQGEPLAIAVFQGEAQAAADNEFLGAIHLTVDRSGDLTLRFAVAADGTLGLAATSPGGQGMAVTLETTEGTDEVRAALLAQAPLPAASVAPRGLFTGIRRLFGRT